MKQKLALSILFLVLVSVYVVKYQKRHIPENNVRSIPTSSPSPSPSYKVSTNRNTGWNIYEKDNLQIQAPPSWKVDKYGYLVKSFGSDDEQSMQCGKPGDMWITIETSEHYRNYENWSVNFAIDNFYDLTNPSWKDYFKSGGGGTNRDTLSLTMLNDGQKAVKFTRIWTDVMECWPKTEYHFFILNQQASTELLVTHIGYEIPGEYKKKPIMEKEINQIMATLKLEK